MASTNSSSLSHFFVGSGIEKIMIRICYTAHFLRIPRLVSRIERLLTPEPSATT
jgi:hypothetical protein